MLNRTKTNGRKPYTDEQVKELLGVHGFILIGEYQGYNGLNSVRCPSGHDSDVTLANFKKTKHKCRYCAGTAKLHQRDVEARFKSVGLTLLEPYANRRAKLLAVCTNGHQVRMSYQSVHNGSGCLECAGVRLKTHAEVEQEFSERGFKLRSEYKGVFEKLDVECPAGHRYQTSRHSFLKATKYGCPYCARVRASTEQQESSTIARKIRIRIAQRLYWQGMLKKDYVLGDWTQQIARAVIMSYGPRPKNHDLDHIIPCSYFDHSDPKQVKLCWHIRNLRWLPKEENHKRRDHLTLKEVEQFSPIQMYFLREASLKPASLNAI